MVTLRPEVVNSLVDTFFECKKSQVKQRLRDSVDAIVDDLFGELVGQVKELLAPGKETAPNADSPTVVHPTSITQAIKVTPNLSGQKATSTSKLTFPPKQLIAVKSAPTGSVTSSSGNNNKRTYELENSESGSPPKKGKTDEYLSFEAPDCDEQIDMSIDQVDFQNQEQPDLKPVPNGTPTSSKFICQHAGCGKSFKKGDNLKNHQRTHSGVKPFSCKYPGCSFATAKRTDAYRHIRNKHLKTGKNGDDGGGDTGDPKDYLEVNEQLLK